MIQKLSIIPAILALLLPVLYFVYHGWFMFAGAAVGFVFLLLLVRRLDSWWTAAIATMGSGVYVAQVTSALKLHDFIVLGFSGLSIVTLIITKHHASRSSLPRMACFAFLAILVATAFWRGWGVQILGSSMWGGLQYITLVSALLFFIYSAHVTLSVDRMWRTIKVFMLLALLPAATAILVRYVPGMNWLGNFVAMGESEVLSEVSTSGRMQILERPAIFAGLFAILLYDRKFRITLPILLLIAVSFVMLGLSGHRASAVMLVLLAMVYLTIRWRSISLAQKYILAIAIMVMVGSLLLFVSNLPLNYQRAFAWVPGLNISYEARMSALSTSNWRIEMWKQMLTMIPDYLWMGRGLAFDLSEAYSAYILQSDYSTRHLFFIAVHNYHNGPLGLLIDLGIGGFVTGITFMIGSGFYYGRRIRFMPAGSRWKTAYVVLFSFFVARCVFFFAVIGGATSLIEMAILAGVLDVISRSAAAAESVTAADKAVATALAAKTGGDATAAAVPVRPAAHISPWGR